MADDTLKPRHVPTLRQRKLAIGANLFVQIVAAVALVVMVNWLAARHYMRFDWTKTRYYEIAEKTRRTLGALKEPVDVVVFIPSADESGLLTKVMEDVGNLLKEMQFFGKDKLNIEYVDPNRNMARARSLVQQYDISTADLSDELLPGIVIFISGGRHKYVKSRELVDLDTGYTAPPRVKAFKGEGVFLSAIQTVTEEKPPKVYFLTGHGEHDPNSPDQRDGYSTLNQYIKRDNITVERLNMMETQALPDDAGVIIVAGPRKELAPAELMALDDYLKKRGGRLLVMLDPHQTTGLETWLRNWGVQVDDDIALAKGGMLLGTELLIANAIGTEYAPHPITAKLADVNTSFPYARSVHRAKSASMPGADRPVVTELVKTPVSFWGETDPDLQHAKFETDKDIKGPLCLAVAVEGNKPSGVELGMAQSRMVLVGTSSFVNNANLSGGNLDFFMNSLNWLLKREQLLAVSPKLPEEFRLDMTPNQARGVYLLVIAGMPLAVALLGLAVWARRRK